MSFVPRSGALLLVNIEYRYNNMTPLQRKEYNSAIYNKCKGKRTARARNKKARAEADLKKRKEDQKREIAEYVAREKGMFPYSDAELDRREKKMINGMHAELSFDANAKTICAVCQERCTLKVSEQIPLAEFKEKHGELLKVDICIFPDRLLADFKFADYPILDGIAIDVYGVFGKAGEKKVHICSRCHGDIKDGIVPDMSIAAGRYIPNVFPEFNELTYIEQLLISKHITKTKYVISYYYYCEC